MLSNLLKILWFFFTKFSERTSKIVMKCEKLVNKIFIDQSRKKVGHICQRYFAFGRKLSFNLCCGSRQLWDPGSSFQNSGSCLNLTFYRKTSYFFVVFISLKAVLRIRIRKPLEYHTFCSSKLLNYVY